MTKKHASSWRFSSTIRTTQSWNILYNPSTFRERHRFRAFKLSSRIIRVKRYIRMRKGVAHFSQLAICTTNWTEIP